MMAPILAKKPKNPRAPLPGETLLGHTLAVVECFEALFGAEDHPTRLGRRWLRFFKLPPEDYKRFWTNCRIACLLHDIGKANSGFLDMLLGKDKQVVRHEHLSGAMLWLPEFQKWLDALPLVDKRVVLSAVVCHHLKLSSKKAFAQESSDTYRNNFIVEWGGVEHLLTEMATRLSLPTPRTRSVQETWSFSNGQADLREAVAHTLEQFKRTLRRDEPLHRLLQAVRAALIVADSAGSGLTREGKSLGEWIGKAFSENELRDAQRIETEIILPRIRQIECRSNKTFHWEDFQDSAETLPERTLLLAACGSGKTLAAWRWIKGRLRERPAARVIFLYPTRGTATEGLKDYVSWAPEGSLVHSTSAFELDGMFSSTEDERSGVDFTVEDRLFALGYWHKRVFSATIHQFLGFMRYTYRSLCLLPLLVDCVLVVDEVHSLDEEFFSSLKSFLKHFDLPVLCMTATLPAPRRRDMEECGLTVFPEDLGQFEDLQRKAAAPRYRCKLLVDKEEAEGLALDAQRQGLRVLWVVNTVDRCQELAKKFECLCYHSRFRLIDRKARHDAVVSAFKDKPGPFLALTTQVCEMSLDLDADVLITELAPVTSLIQRLGRCNRHLKRERGMVYFYAPEDPLPYTTADLDGAQDFIQALDGHDASQTRLDELLAQFGPRAVEVERQSPFLHSGPWAEPKPEKDERTVQAILDGDLDEYCALRRAKKPVDGLVLPVPWYPLHLTRQHPRLANYLRLAETARYSPEYGFTKTSPWRCYG